VRISCRKPSEQHANIFTDVIILAAMGEECAIEGKEAPRGS